MKKTEASNLFRAIVIVGASLGAAACTEHGKSPPDSHLPDSGKTVVDARTLPDAPVDVIIII